MVFVTVTLSAQATMGGTKESKRATRLQKMQSNPRLLKRFDTNKDGKIDESEFAVMRAKRKENRTKWDTNGDGKLDDTEKATRKETNKSKRLEKMQSKPRLMKRFDTNGDGKLDDNEIAQMKAKRKENRAKFDTNGDGKLDANERATRKAARKAAKK